MSKRTRESDFPTTLVCSNGAAIELTEPFAGFVSPVIANDLRLRVLQLEEGLHRANKRLKAASASTPTPQPIQPRPLNGPYRSASEQPDTPRPSSKRPAPRPIFEISESPEPATADAVRRQRNRSLLSSVVAVLAERCAGVSWDGRTVLLSLPPETEWDKVDFESVLGVPTFTSPERVAVLLSAQRTLDLFAHNDVPFQLWGLTPQGEIEVFAWSVTASYHLNTQQVTFVFTVAEQSKLAVSPSASVSTPIDTPERQLPAVARDDSSRAGSHAFETPARAEAPSLPPLDTPRSAFAFGQNAQRGAAPARPQLDPPALTPPPTYSKPISFGSFGSAAHRQDGAQPQARAPASAVQRYQLRSAARHQDGAQPPAAASLPFEFGSFGSATRRQAEPQPQPQASTSAVQAFDFGSAAPVQPDGQPSSQRDAPTAQPFRSGSAAPRQHDTHSSAQKEAPTAPPVPFGSALHPKHRAQPAAIRNSECLKGKAFMFIGLFSKPTNELERRVLDLGGEIVQSADKTRYFVVGSNHGSQQYAVQLALAQYHNRQLLDEAKFEHVIKSISRQGPGH